MSFKIFWNIDRRIYYGLLFIIVCLLLLYPIGVPLKVSPEVTATWQKRRPRQPLGKPHI